MPEQQDFRPQRNRDTTTLIQLDLEIRNLSDSTVQVRETNAEILKNLDHCNLNEETGYHHSVQEESTAIFCEDVVNWPDILSFSQDGGSPTASEPKSPIPHLITPTFADVLKGEKARLAEIRADVDKHSEMWEVQKMINSHQTDELFSDDDESSETARDEEKGTEVNKPAESMVLTMYKFCLDSVNPVPFSEVNIVQKFWHLWSVASLLWSSLEDWHMHIIFNKLSLYRCRETN
ncbi:uncharacterized protein LOC110856259 isoform X2 [Folsomia candida]|uniref:uncharacterized protein LOC110856259 isoform X2 n=1 Tax=Folsomia candida TaxID=158441 RepID=UPI000B8FDF2B|nr:uncharacterized protein LOC110856259 isoform X2 [Folsomia candida]